MSPRDDETRDDAGYRPAPAPSARPGLVAVFVAGAPALRVFDVGPGGIELGRATPAGLLEGDDRASRRHARVARQGQRWVVEDLSSRNGTFVDGRPLESTASLASPVLIRVGRSLLWAVDDVSPYAGSGAPSPAGDGPIVGAALRRAHAEIVIASRAGDTLCIRGESGSGKELAARAFHSARHTTADAPFVAVNCAAIPEGLAERLLFGARKGAYSGATADAEGYVQAADGGTLFLDEVAELGPLIQAKLLRVLETREVLPLGAARAKPVSFALCAASHRSLLAEVSAGRFRQDLYYRVGRPEVVLPPLRERVDEIPAFIARELRRAAPGLTASAQFVETCCLRPWPGNVRELVREVSRAAHRAADAGVAVVDSEHLSSEAGAPLPTTPDEGARPTAGEPARPDTREVRRREHPPGAGRARERSDEEIRKALADNRGNVRGTARALGMHRNQLRRWLARHPDAEFDPEV